MRICRKNCESPIEELAKNRAHKGGKVISQEIFETYITSKEIRKCKWGQGVNFASQITKDGNGKLSLSLQISPVAQSCPTLCDPMNRSTPGLLVHHQLPEFTQTHIHRVSDAIQPSHLLSSPSPPAPNPSQHQSLFQWVNSSHEVAKVLEFQL